MNAEQSRLDEITKTIIGCAYRVSNVLGTGFLEKVYENALAHELRKAGLNVQQQAPVRVLYDGVVVGEYFADILTDGPVTIELKVVKALDDVHMAQCLNYLRATGHKVCLLLNFNETKVAVKRIVNDF
ncbi:MAG: GxxExxY protein [Phycisphaerae bacterium]|nr:GxxExxY protein [Phycisphaerae bacterium]